MIIELKRPVNNHEGKYCFHDYNITRVVMDHPKGGVVVMGDDNKFHVVHKDCVGNQPREIYG